MIADKQRHTKYFWPELYPDSKNKRAIRNIANGTILAGRGNTTQYGGITTQLLATESRSHLWTLAEVLYMYSMAPRIAAMRNRIAIPAVFSDLAEQELNGSARRMHRGLRMRSKRDHFATF